jgi:hypothetical protein
MSGSPCPPTLPLTAHKVGSHNSFYISDSFSQLLVTRNTGSLAPFQSGCRNILQSPFPDVNKENPSANQAAVQINLSVNGLNGGNLTMK